VNQSADNGVGPPAPAATPSGCLLTVVRDGQVVVWLIGEIGVDVMLELRDVALHAPRVADRLVIDGSRVTFCESDLIRFIAAASAALPVSVRRPSRVLADILAFSGLTRVIAVEGDDRDPSDESRDSQQSEQSHESEDE
jgi:anti-anti-sigma regulatory factor